MEMLAAIAVLLIILGIIGAATNGARTTISRSTNEIGAFAIARSSFEAMTQKLSQATLNTYWDYYAANGWSRGSYAGADAANGTTTISGFVPATYGRASDLHFFIRQNTQQYFNGQEVYFQTPVAYSNKSGTAAAYRDTQGLLNNCSFFVEYCPDSTFRPTTIGASAPVKWRYRLMAGLESTEYFQTYKNVALWQASQKSPLGQSQPSSTAILTSSVGFPAVWPSGTPVGWAWTQYIHNETGPTGPGTGPNTGAITSALNVTPIADNVIALIIWPRLPVREDPTGNLPTSLTKDYTYDSQADLNVLPTTTSPQNPWDEQLPPVVQVTAVVIDEISAARLAATASGKNVPTNLKNAFLFAGTDAGYSNSGYTASTKSWLFTISTQDQYTKDLIALGNRLSQFKINYKVLNTFVVMRESKWSQ